jgi:hypothetical protein
MYLDEIAERLWSGHAAVMVGAGFSKNAKCNASTPKPFPDWNQLGNLFYEKIQGDSPSSTQHYLNVLKLAEEVRAAFGRSALDQLLRSNIPDKDHEPSSLHVKLLELPWIDIFTTNYDTLLERACAFVTSQKYDIVVNKEDLVYSEKPRIIKLHGSFPSERPFIITEEDYRNYPKEFAPFVNTVQQALLENTLCLIGFSGDDPNFLQWIGWIRDNLGKENSPKMFLVGIFSLSDAQKKLLEQRNIVLIDLAVCSDVGGNHIKAFDLFCDYLLSKKEDDNRLGWPGVQKSLQPDPRNSDQVKQLTGILAEWKRARLSYPGWVILPEDRRDFLWTFTQGWLNFLSLIKTFSYPSDIELLYELNWRLERCLCPIPNSMSENYEEILGKYNPFPDVVDVETAMNLRESTEHEKIPWDEIQEKWLELYLSLLRFYREKSFSGKWNTVNKMLEKLYSHLSSQQIASLHFERTMFALFSLNLPSIREQLAAWPINKSLPFWEAKRAGLLAEIGEMEEAEKILEKSLSYIRSQLNLVPVKNDYALVSQESCVMLLLQYVKNARAFIQGQFEDREDIRHQFTERWNTLKQYKCDPWNELKLFEIVLEHKPSYTSAISEKHEFDIGRVTRTHHFQNIDKEAFTAYSFLRFCENAGIAFRIPGSTIAKKSAEGALTRISNHSPYWAFATLFRLGDSKIVDSIYNRESIYKMDIKTIDDFVDEYLRAIEKCQPDIERGNNFQRDNFGILLAQMIPEILSRMCCKCSDETKEKLFAFLLDVYTSDQRHKYKGVKHLAERLINAYSVRGQCGLIPKLLDFPILKDVHLVVRDEFPNPFIFLKINEDVAPKECSIKVAANIIGELLQKAGSDNADERKWAVFVLVKLYKLSLLRERMIEEFANVLWTQTDSFGFPTNTDFYKFTFLDLPHPSSISPVALFKKYVAAEKIPIQSDKAGNGISITGGRIPICHEILGSDKYIDWSEEEVVGIFNRLVDWWDKDKHYLKKDAYSDLLGSIKEKFKARFRYLIDILADVISPRFNSNIDQEVKQSLKRLFGEFSEYGMPGLRTEAACIYIFPDREKGLYFRVEEAISSNMHEEVVDALKAIWKILKSTQNGKPSAEIFNFLGMLGQQIKWRRKVGLISSMNIVARIVKEFPQLLYSELQSDVLIGLDYLLKETDLGFQQKVFNVSDQLAFRKSAAHFAYTFYKFFSGRGEQIPEVISKWGSICSSENEFAEIRNQWLEIINER